MSAQPVNASLSGAFFALVRRDLLLAFRRRTELLFPVIFLLVVVSLFLGLVSGPQVVEVAVAERVATVELRLDGRAVGRLAGPPWRAEVDFGDALATHRLEAVARSRTGTGGRTRAAASRRGRQ